MTIRILAIALISTFSFAALAEEYREISKVEAFLFGVCGHDKIKAPSQEVCCDDVNDNGRCDSFEFDEAVMALNAYLDAGTMKKLQAWAWANGRIFPQDLLHVLKNEIENGEQTYCLDVNADGQCTSDIDPPFRW